MENLLASIKKALYNEVDEIIEDLHLHVQCNTDIAENQKKHKVEREAIGLITDFRIAYIDRLLKKGLHKKELQLVRCKGCTAINCRRHEVV